MRIMRPLLTQIPVPTPDYERRVSRGGAWESIFLNGAASDSYDQAYDVINKPRERPLWPDLLWWHRNKSLDIDTPEKESPLWRNWKSKESVKGEYRESKKGKEKGHASPPFYPGPASVLQQGE